MGGRCYTLSDNEFYDLSRKLLSDKDFEFKGHVYTSFHFSDESSRQRLFTLLETYPLGKLSFHKCQFNEKSEQRDIKIHSIRTSLFSKEKQYVNLVDNKVKIDLVIESPMGDVITCAIHMQTDSIKQQKFIIRGNEHQLDSSELYTEKVIACSLL